MIVTPAMAGPMMRPALKMVELMATALANSSRPTISTAKACRVGVSTAEMTPTATASTITCQTVTVWVTASRPRINAAPARALWVRSRSRRLSDRSASMPPQSPSTTEGRNCSAVTTPSAVAEFVSCSTSQSWATRCIQVPVSETSCPLANSR